MPDSLIFFRVPVSSAAVTGMLIKAAVMAAPNRWGTIRIKISSTLFFLWSRWRALSFSEHCNEALRIRVLSVEHESCQALTLIITP
ncbi:hypothetical protein D3C75_1170120 [compost metagenome]